MRKRIIRRLQPCMPEALALRDLHPVLQRVYSNRGVGQYTDLDYSLTGMLPLDRLQGIAKAVRILQQAIGAGQRLLILGDFDADGATSTALAVRALRSMGAKDVHYLVPNRFEYGYGLTPEIVDVAAEYHPDVLITVDNGISSLEGVAAAKEAGMTVVITDHHLAGERLPDADAIVNPNQPGCDFSSKALAGVGVIFYLMMALRAALRESGWFTPQRAEPNLAQLLDLVALGTIADVVPLDRNNRVLVSQGLRRIRAGQCCAGISALLQVAGRNQSQTVSSDLAFAVGPRLNAAGRLQDMSLGIECLLEDNASKALGIAQQLNDLNLERKAIEHEMQQAALADMQKLLDELDQGELPTGICLYDPEWHQGVIGILASRIKERFYRPVIAFADAGEGQIKGSARSIEGLHIRDALDNIAVQNPGLIQKFGGHAMAAGLSLRAEDFHAFRDAFDREAARQLDADALRHVIESDGELLAHEMNLELAEILRKAGPWGQHFPEPLFDGEFELINWRIVGEKHLKMQLLPEAGAAPIDAIAFNTPLEAIGEQADSVRAVYRLDVNEYRNRRNVQLLVEYLEPL